MSDLAPLVNAPKRFICSKCGCGMTRAGVGDDMTYLVTPDSAEDLDPVRCVVGGEHDPTRIGINA